MSILPANLARVPNLLANRVSLGNIQRTSVDLVRVQQQVATGREISRPSDDIVRTATIATLDDRLERAEQLSRNMTHATSSLNILDSVFEEANAVALEAKGIALAQVGLTSSPAERQGQAAVVDQLIRSLFNTSNRTSPAGYVLGGSRAGQAAFEEFFGGFRYLGEGAGLTTDLGLASTVPITLGAGNPIAGLSARVRGSVDFNPSATLDTRLVDVGGARGVGVTLGRVEMSINGGPVIGVELEGADTLGQVAARLTAAVRSWETENGVTVLGPGGVGVLGGALNLDVVGGPTAPSVRFFDVGSGTTGQDLGIVGDPPVLFGAGGGTVGLDVQPRLTLRTPVSAMAGLGLGGPSGVGLGQVRIGNAGRWATIDLSGAQTLGDIKTLIETANLGVRVGINAAGNGIDIVSAVATSSSQSLAIEDVSDGTSTATRLGVRSLVAETSIADFNFGRGVPIVDGRNNPLTGTVDPSLNVDLRITLGDAAGTRIDVDLRPQDMATVATVLARINDQAASQLAAAGLSPTDLVAGLTDGPNGIALRQNGAFGGPIRVEAVNNSGAAEALGLLDGTYAGNVLRGSDRARARVDSLFTNLLDLREALASNDTRGIGLAGEALEGSLNGLGEVRGLVGGLARRVDDAAVREEDRKVTDESIRSDLRDVDMASAASRFSLLQTQLEAGLRVAAQSQQLTLLNFIG